MTWQGVPFPFNHTSDIWSLIIEKIPPIEITTGFAWDSVISSIVAGAIPAYIAWKAIENNHRLAELQSRQSMKKELAEKLRIAALDYICSVEILGLKSYQLLNDKSVNRKDLEKGLFPQYYQSLLHKVQREERNLCLLIEPTEKGIVLLEKLPYFQDTLQNFFTDSDSFDKGFDELKKVSDNFVLEFHKYMSSF
ncbi:hypothetical protein F3J27_09085 [Enterobacter sp. Ap-916]|uniref:hypothetical protein n=1 Tax=unclassified Enterobacter TaxID=2608935 RepID=UPI00141ED321|nr:MULTISPECIES: hypothetical protein [unclassified Enterobacter]NIF58950.1 hypothetical protein [Enterobacter sp. Ap-867]NIG29634.1 hypothetical protein [Enterobacter sp. Ap-916]